MDFVAYISSLGDREVRKIEKERDGKCGGGHGGGGGGGESVCVCM